MEQIIRFLIALTMFQPISGFATAYQSENHEDVSCEWSTPKEAGKGICHIIMQGTHMGETMMAFRIGKRPEIITVSDQVAPTISFQAPGQENWKVIWRGNLIEDSMKKIGRHWLETIKLSNGYTIKLMRD